MAEDDLNDPEWWPEHLAEVAEFRKTLAPDDLERECALMTPSPREKGKRRARKV